MTPLSDTSRSSSASSSKLTLLSPFRRNLAVKSKRESELVDLGAYVAKPRIISSLTTSEVPSRPLLVSRTPTSDRVRMSGSRLPSGYRRTPVPQTTPAISSPASELPSSEPKLAPQAPPPHPQTRLARLFPLHSAAPTRKTSTPSSSTYSFPSSSSGTSDTTSTCTTTPITPPKRVRFSLSTNSTSESAQEKGHARSKSLPVFEAPKEKSKARWWGKQ